MNQAPRPHDPRHEESTSSVPPIAVFQLAALGFLASIPVLAGVEAWQEHKENNRQDQQVAIEGLRTSGVVLQPKAHSEPVALTGAADQNVARALENTAERHHHEDLDIPYNTIVSMSLPDNFNTSKTVESGGAAMFPMGKGGIISIPMHSSKDVRSQPVRQWIIKRDIDPDRQDDLQVTALLSRDAPADANISSYFSEANDLVLRMEMPTPAADTSLYLEVQETIPADQ